MDPQEPTPPDPGRRPEPGPDPAGSRGQRAAAQRQPMLREPGSYHYRDAQTHKPSPQSRPDIGLPWRVDEFERWWRGRSYDVYDRRGVLIATFSDLKLAKAVVSLVNGSA